MRPSPRPPVGKGHLHLGEAIHALVQRADDPPVELASLQLGWHRHHHAGILLAHKPPVERRERLSRAHLAGFPQHHAPNVWRNHRRHEVRDVPHRHPRLAGPDRVALLGPLEQGQASAGVLGFLPAAFQRQIAFDPRQLAATVRCRLGVFEAGGRCSWAGHRFLVKPHAYRAAFRNWPGELGKEPICATMGHGGHCSQTPAFPNRWRKPMGRGIASDSGRQGRGRDALERHAVATRRHRPHRATAVPP